MAESNQMNALEAKVQKVLIAKYRKILTKDLDMLEEITKKHYAKGVLGGRTPAMYQRTGNLVGSVYSGEIKVVGRKITGVVKFDARAMHESLFPNGWGYTPKLVSDGWHWRRPHKVIPNFTDYEGSRALDLIEQEFNSRKSKYTNRLKIIGR